MATVLDIECYRNEQVVINFTVTGLSDLTGLLVTFAITDGPGGTALYTMNRTSGNIINSGGNGTAIIPHEATNRQPETYNYTLSTSSPPTMWLEGEFKIKRPLTI